MRAGGGREQAGGGLEEGGRRAGGGNLTGLSVLKQTEEGPFLGERLRKNVKLKKKKF